MSKWKNCAPAALAGALFFAQPSYSQDLLFPVECTLGTDCFIQQYVDRDPGAGASDFTCGPLSYDGHQGTDIRVPDLAAMQAGVAVRAATAGVVRGVRDGMADYRYGDPGAPDLKGRDCGNGVLIAREDGWTFQYCHLRRGSVAVRKGDTVEAGDYLGLIGLSGRSQFPHLHLTVKDQAKRVIDPFDTRQQDSSCELPDRQDLWRDKDNVGYQPGGALSAGMLDRLPDYQEIKQGEASIDQMSTDAAALVFWAHFFGLRTDDVIDLVLTGPTGEVSSSSHRMLKNQAQRFRAVGRKAKEPWPPGTYRGVAKLLRDGGAISTIERVIEIR